MTRSDPIDYIAGALAGGPQILETEARDPSGEAPRFRPVRSGADVRQGD
jgi:hypothetical protein